MRICILTERMRLGFGVDLVVDQQARRLVELGHDVIVVVIHADLVQPRRAYRLVVINRVIRVDDYGSAAGVRRILSALKINDVDLWILQTPPFYHWVNHLDAPVVVVEHGSPPGHFFAPALGRVIDGTANERLQTLYTALKPSDAILSISHSIHAWLPKAAQARSTVIHNGCDHYPRASRAQAEALRASFGIKPTDCILLWVGRMQLEHDEQPYKGFQELLNLLPLVEQEVKDARFVLAGRVTDTDKARLEARGIRIFANLTSEQLSTAYAAADALVNLSRWEGFNLALLEAQYQGTPVVAYDVGPHREIVKHNETGLLAATPQALYHSVVRIARDRALRQRLADQAAPFAAEFKWDRSVAQLAKLAEDCLARAADRYPSAAGSSSSRDTVDEVAPTETVSLDADEGRQADMPLTAGDTKPEIPADVTTSTEQPAAPARSPGRWKPLLEWLHLAPRVTAGLLNPGRSLPCSRWFQLDDEAFVRLAYETLLGREATDRAMEYWKRRLRDGDGRQKILAALRFSHEGAGRPVHDRDLHEIFACEWFRRLPVIGPIFHESERETLPRQIRRIESRQRALAGELLAASDVPRSSSISTNGRKASSSPGVPDIPETPQAPFSNLHFTRAPLLAFGHKLGSTHTLVVAPGAALESTAFERLAEAAKTVQSDLLIGDEIERVDTLPSGRLRRHGPFSHEAFLRAPDLGGAIAVHNTLLEQLDLPRTVVLTGGMVLKLAAQAHTITYLNTVLSSRSSGDIEANRPSIDEMRSYLRRIQRDSLVGDAAGGYDVRFDVKVPWKAAVIIVAPPDEDENVLEGSIERIRSCTPPDQFAWLVARSSRVERDGSKDEGKLEFARDAKYGLTVNEAVKKAPSECDLIVVMDSGVSPTSPDWLERLAETALSSRAGVVAPITTYADGRIRHAGMALGTGKPCGYIARFERLSGSPDAFKTGELDHVAGLREVSVAARHCLMIRRKVFEDRRGFSSELGRDAADVDLCLRLRTVGKSNFVDGRVVMVQHDPMPTWSRILCKAELEALTKRHHRSFAEADPCWIPAKVDPSGPADAYTARLAPIDQR